MPLVQHPTDCFVGFELGSQPLQKLLVDTVTRFILGRTFPLLVSVAEHSVIGSKALPTTKRMSRFSTSY
ncbi:MAG: hypothetical protein CMJ64_12230 [Planctomycetaceae bacterium]|nr:hypothetical protein [Planctomycetaceae bacterium]